MDNRLTKVLIPTEEEIARYSKHGFASFGLMEIGKYLTGAKKVLLDIRAVSRVSFPLYFWERGQIFIEPDIDLGALENPRIVMADSRIRGENLAFPLDRRFHKIERNLDFVGIAIDANRINLDMM